MTEITWASSARREFAAAIAHLDKESPSGADRVGAQILRSIETLAQFPERAPRSRHRGLRQLVVPRTRYLVIYRFANDTVEIRAIIHTSRKRRR